MAGADTSALRGITNLLPLAQIMRWNWKMVQRQPILAMSVILSAGGGFRAPRLTLLRPFFGWGGSGASSIVGGDATLESPRTRFPSLTSSRKQPVPTAALF